MSDPPIVAGRCPECGAEQDPLAERCWLCQAAMPEPRESEQLPHIKTSVSDEPILLSRQKFEPGQGQFSLAMLLLGVTLAAVFFGVMSYSMPLAIGLLVLVTPALLRARASSAIQRRRQETPVTMGDWFASFAGSFGLMILVAVAVGVAFYGTCWVGFLGGAGVAQVSGATDYDALGGAFIFGIGLGILAGGALLVYLLYRTWPRLRHKEKDK